MIVARIDASGFIDWLHRAESDFLAGARQALGQSVALALRHARETTAFRDRTGELRRSIVRGQKSTWNHFIKAGAKHALFVEEDTKPHRIEVKRRRSLRFVQSGEIRFRRFVNHPGTKGTHFMAKAGEVGERALMDMLERAVDRAFK